MESSGTLGEGTFFAGHRIEGILGRGGMGVVYRATHIALDAPRALKVIAPHLARDDEFRERFRREARTAASLSHPHVVAIHDTGEVDGVLYISMQHIAGRDLSELISERGRLEPAEATTVLAHVAEALDAAHGRGLVHRDIKPANVLVEQTAEGLRGYATDFGLTKPVSSESGFTATGVLVGSIDYMAPEQFSGAPLDARTDVYALGAVYFSALTGTVPFPGATPAEKMFGHTTRDVPAVSAHVAEIDPVLDRIVAKALAKDPDARFQSAGDLGRAALAAARGGQRTEQIGSIATGAAAVGMDATQELSTVEEAQAVEPPPVAPPPPPRAPAAPTTRMPEPTPSSGRPAWLVPAAVIAVAAAAAVGGFLIASSDDDGSRNVIKVDGPGGGEESSGGDDEGSARPGSGGSTRAASSLTSYSPSDPTFTYRAKVPQGEGFSPPVENELTPGELLRTTVRGPDGLLVIVDRTPFEVPQLGGVFDSEDTVAHPFFGTMTEYVFSNSGAIPECADTTCVDYLIEDGSGGGWGVLAGGGADFGLAQQTALGVANSIRP
ncbi:MAG: serine/threonine-protein kinase [Solirubrobacterales bacterium]